MYKHLLRDKEFAVDHENPNNKKSKYYYDSTVDQQKKKRMPSR
jgi:hypothetical protein